MCDIHRRFHIMDFDNDFYMVKINTNEGIKGVLNYYSWVVCDHYLAISNWSC